MSRSIRRKHNVFNYEDDDDYNYPVRKLKKFEQCSRIDKINQDHGDNNDYTPNHSYRLCREKQLRTRNKLELVKFMKTIGDHEPMCLADPLSHLWDWN